MDDQLFSDEFRAARLAAGLTQRTAAAILQISFETVSKWERGLICPKRYAQIGALAMIREMTPEDRKP